MPRIYPFPSLHYNNKLIPNLSDVIIPPYDVIKKDEAEKFLKRNPYNFSHILLPQGPNDDYTRATTLLGKWKDVHILTSIPTPCFYLYEQTFKLEGATYKRRTLMCTVPLSDFSKGHVRPHENTYGQFKADRLQIMKKTQHNLSHIFGMVKDPDGYLASQFEKWSFGTPLLKANSDDGVHHTVWEMDRKKSGDVGDFFEDKPIYIVDGHHRYESALMYAKEIGALGDPEHPANYMMFAIANAYDPAMAVLPTHRVLKEGTEIDKSAIEERFDLAETTEAALREFVSTNHKVPAFGLILKGEPYLCTPKNWHSLSKELGESLASLAVVWSDEKLVKEILNVPDTERSSRIVYEKDFSAAWAQKEKSPAIILHAPISVESVMDVADEKKFLPQKTTYFYPKLSAGLILRSLKKD